MILKKETSIITFGDFLDVYHKLRENGMKYLFAKLKLTHKGRVTSKWDSYVSSSDFWIIPEIGQDWNESISGDKDVEYEDYVAQKFLSGKSGLKILSIGCGEGVHERKFAKHSFVSKIVGVDISEGSIATARRLAKEENLDIEYIASDFFKVDFEKASFDVVLFNSSLHHFPNIPDFIKNEIKPLLKGDGLLVVFEYCGPNRLQWKDSQLKEANRLLKELPKKYKTLYDGKTLKKRVYRPGLIRMFLVDPSEAPDSANLVKGIHDNFSILEEKRLGWNILMLLLKGIAHNFINDKPETKELLARLITDEKKYLRETGENDAIFGVYQKITE